jgi:hypothetical protein
MFKSTVMFNCSEMAEGPAYLLKQQSKPDRKYKQF